MTSSKVTMRRGIGNRRDIKEKEMQESVQKVSNSETSEQESNTEEESTTAKATVRKDKRQRNSWTREDRPDAKGRNTKCHTYRTGHGVPTA